MASENKKDFNPPFADEISIINRAPWFEVLPTLLKHD